MPYRIQADGPDVERGIVHITKGAAGPGFTAGRVGLVVITEADLLGGTTAGQGGSTKDMRRMPSKRRNQVDPLSLRPGTTSSTSSTASGGSSR